MAPVEVYVLLLALFGVIVFMVGRQSHAERLHREQEEESLSKQIHALLVRWARE